MHCSISCSIQSWQLTAQLKVRQPYSEWTRQASWAKHGWTCRQRHGRTLQWSNVWNDAYLKYKMYPRGMHHFRRLTLSFFNFEICTWLFEFFVWNTHAILYHWDTSSVEWSTAHTCTCAWCLHKRLFRRIWYLRTWTELVTENKAAPSLCLARPGFTRHSSIVYTQAVIVPTWPISSWPSDKLGDMTAEH